MNRARVLFALFAAFPACFNTGLAQSETVFPSSGGKTILTESMSFFPTKTPAFVSPPVIRLPSRSFSGFASSIPDSETDVKKQGIVCGPTTGANTITCFGVPSGSLLGEWPLPGTLTTRPVFFENSWILGTSKGFLLRVDASEGLHLPALGQQNTQFWGSLSRQEMHYLRPLAANAIQSKAAANEQKKTPSGWRWYFTGSSEYIGTPVISGNTLYVMSANQFVQAFDVQNGRLLWGVRLAADAPLRLAGASLVVTGKEVLVGTNDGAVIALQPRDGKQLWKTALPMKADDRFHAISAQITLAGRSIIFSNAESMTNRISLDGQSVEWSYGVGSIAQTRIFGDRAFIGGTDGSVTCLNAMNGEVHWKRMVSPESPVASLSFSKMTGYLVVASKNGALSVLDNKGVVRQSGRRLGEVAGEFFPGAGDSEVCLSFVAPGVRCFTTTVLRSGIL